MSYQIYKVIHLASIFLFLTSASVLLLTDKKTMFWKIFTGVASFFVLFGGMGLLARLEMAKEIPGWAIAKIVIWLFVTGLGHMVAKRFPKYGFAAYGIMMVLAIYAATLAVYKF